MAANKRFLQMIPVLPTNNTERDIAWFEKYMGFSYSFGDDMYCGLTREQMEIHLQWHADNEQDPLLGGSVIKLFVENIDPFYEEFLERGTITPDRLRRNTPWKTDEFGFYDLNKNAIFIVQDL